MAASLEQPDRGRMATRARVTRIRFDAVDIRVGLMERGGRYSKTGEGKR